MDSSNSTEIQECLQKQEKLWIKINKTLQRLGLSHDVNP